MTDPAINAFRELEVLILILENLIFVFKSFAFKKLLRKVLVLGEKYKTLNRSAVSNTKIVFRWKFSEHLSCFLQVLVGTHVLFLTEKQKTV